MARYSRVRAGGFALTPSEWRLLALIASTEATTGAPSAKHDLATVLGVNVKTVDRAMSSLRREGLVVTEPRFGENGGQLSNVYRTTELALQTWPDLRTQAVA